MSEARGSLAAGIALALLVLGLCFLGPLLYRASPVVIHPAHGLQGPGLAFPLGTDELGRDGLALLLAGGRATLVVSLPAALLAFCTGLAYGLLAGLGPGWADRVLMRLLDVVLAMPSLVVLIFFAALVPLNDVSLVLLLGLVSWPGLARLVRNEVLAQRNRDFILAARQAGAGPLHIARVHLLRAIAPVLVVNGTFLVGDAIFALSALSFLGLGVQPPQVSWGSLMQSALNIIALAPWWLILPPGLMIFASLLAASLIGRGLAKR
jgi:peptide/nickel transport system permease protein